MKKGGNFTAWSEKEAGSTGTVFGPAADLPAGGAGRRFERGRWVLLQAEPGRHLHTGLRRHDASPPRLSGRPDRLGGRDGEQR